MKKSKQIPLLCVALCVSICRGSSKIPVDDVESEGRDAVEVRAPPVVPTTISIANIFGTDLEEQPYTKRQCRPRPDSITICRGVPYKLMFVPNLLGHERMSEIIQQSDTWAPLLSSNCHPQLQQFLCAMYAPVCIEDQPGGTFPPCRSLCEAVRDGCAPVMSKFGFPWPTMLNCDKFPQKNDKNSMCMGIETNPAPELRTCAPCRKKMSKSSLKKKLCGYDFVMKMRVRSLAFGEDSFKINVDRKSRVIYKWFDQISPSFKPGKDMRRITLHMRHTTNCTCDVVNTKKTPYLVTGWKQGNKYMIHYITKWQKRTKRIVKVLRKKRCMRAYRITRNNRNAN